VNHEHTTLSYQVISYLLRYPNQQIVSTLGELKQVINSLDDEIKQELVQFMDSIESISFDNWINHYIEIFDFGRQTSLYITYLKLGEQRERGLELLKLKKYYEAHGFDITDEELPDYLPLILEFCANVPKETSSELLNMHIESLEFTRKKLSENNSPYVHLFNTLLITMKNNKFPPLYKTQ